MRSTISPPANNRRTEEKCIGLGGPESDYRLACRYELTGYRIGQRVLHLRFMSAKNIRKILMSSHAYLSRVPNGTSSRKLASTGLPPSGEAATIMPFDSNPRNLRGARFATITTLRPISVSGS